MQFKDREFKSFQILYQELPLHKQRELLGADAKGGDCL